MKPPTFVRPLTDQERKALQSRLRSPDAFTLRRCQILLASAGGLGPAQIRARFGCASQTVRNAIGVFHAEGLDCLHERSHRPKSARPELDEARCQRLCDLSHRCPRDFGKPASVWTLATAAEVCHQQKITGRLVSDETIRQALKRLGVGWKRATTWITGPDPASARNKTRATG